VSILINAHQISKSFSARPLFSGLTFAVESGERVGLIGPNGAGKSTLLKILAQRVAPDSGTLSCQRGLRVGFLEQVPSYDEGATILSVITGGDWGEGARASELISRLELDQFGPDHPIESLSGGWRKRVALARELMKSPDLLLLDEPTNHLDVESILWLEGLLAQAPYAIVTVTHDRAFLQRVANRILELDSRHAGGLLAVKGDYATFVEVREQMIASQERREVILKNTLRRETEWLRQGAKARTTKQQARIQRAGELAEEVEGLTFRNQDRRARMNFQSAERNPKKLVQAKALGKSYGDQIIFSDLDLLLTPGSRLGLLGRNGSGKSTLIRVLLGLEEPSQGSVVHAEQLAIAYFDQSREHLDLEKTVSKTLCPSGEWVDYRGARVHIRSYLDRFLFTQGQADMAVGKLSGGEQSRLLLARLMLRPANLLVLDEPTNDLDLATLAVLEECLTEFDGAVILVSHDRYFLDRVANQLLALADGEILAFADLAQWETWIRKGRRSRGELARASGQSAAGGKPAPAVARQRLGFKEQRELTMMEPTILAAEDKLKRLTRESELPANASNAVTLAKLTQEMAETQFEIERLYARWAELESRSG